MQGSGRVDILTHRYTTAACATGWSKVRVTGTAGRNSCRYRYHYRYNENQRARQLCWIGNAMESNRHTTCMKIRGIALSSSFIVYFAPSAGRWKKKRKKKTRIPMQRDQRIEASIGRPGDAYILSPTQYLRLPHTFQALLISTL